MDLQYIFDSTGKTTGVFIPISQWNKIKAKYKGIEQEQGNVPTWQTEEVLKRLDNYKDNPDQQFDFDRAMDDIEKKL